MAAMDADRLDYSRAGIAVREDLQAAHRAIWEHVRAPGAWWTGAERVAMVAEARRADGCRLCRARKDAVSPAAAAGEHASDGRLPAPIVDVVHRVRTDPARLSRQWFDGVVAGGVGDAAYVELIGVVTIATGVEYFARALGVAPIPLPPPLAGEPSRRRPPAAKPGPGWVATIAAEDAAGPEADVYGGLPFVPNIVRALSLVPDAVRVLRMSSAAHYVAVEQIPDPTVRRALDRMQMELVAARVSALNECFY